jgi:hypothetical protein
MNADSSDTDDWKMFTADGKIESKSCLKISNLDDNYPYFRNMVAPS